MRAEKDRPPGTRAGHPGRRGGPGNEGGNEVPALGQIGKYELLHSLAVGGMAEVFLARQTGMQGFEKVVVIKRILPHLANQARFVQMFLDEARLAARFNHPNIVQAIDAGQDDQQARPQRRAALRQWPLTDGGQQRRDVL